MTPSARLVPTDRGEIYTYESGPTEGTPVVLIHGNLSTGRYFEQVMAAAPSDYRMIAPDMRGFGRTPNRRVDATRGLRDWSDDAAALVHSLGTEQPVHLAGWSTGGAAVATYAIDRPDEVASLTFIDPVSPYGYGGVRADGTAAFADCAGSGGGTGNPDFAAAIAAGDRTTASDLSPLNVLRSSYWAKDFTVDPEFEQVLLDEVLLSEIGDDGYPGDVSPSENWPGIAPGTGGVLNALSPKYCNWTAIVEIEPKPRVLWTHGSDDIVVANGSPWEMGTLGSLGVVPDCPGPEVFPPQPMVDQIRAVLDEYAARGGSVTSEIFEGSGHAPFIDARDRWQAVFFDFLAG